MTQSTHDVPTPDAYWVTVPWLITGRLLAGEYPYAKDPVEGRRKLGRYLDAGVTTFIDLTEEGEYHLHPYAAEAAELGTARGLSITHQRHSIPDLGLTTPERMAMALDAIDSALAASQTVYVHCFGGIGRTGTVVGCWLVRHGLSGDEALRQIAAWRAGTPDGHRRSPETPEQRQFVGNWSE